MKYEEAMKYDDVIRTLANDCQPVPVGPRPALMAGGFLLWTVLAMAVFMSLAPGITGAATLRALIALAALTVGAATSAAASAIPGRRLLAGILVATVGLIVWVGDIAAGFGSDLWGPVSWIKCFRFTAVFGIALSFAWTALLRRTWPTRPRLTVALALTASASAAALATTLECVSSASLHVFVGHLLPVLILAVVGAYVGPRLFLSR